MMGDIVNYCFHLSTSQGVSYLRESIGNYVTMLILRGVSPSSRPSIATQRLIRMPPDGDL